MLPALGNWGNNAGTGEISQGWWGFCRTGYTGKDSLTAENVPKQKVLREERFAGEESINGMGITWYHSKTWLDLLSSSLFHFLPWHQAQHPLMQCTQLRTDSSFLSITTKTRDMLQAQQESKPSPSPKCPVSPSWTTQRTPTTTEPEQWRARAATHRLWAGPWPCRVAQLDPPGARLPLSFPPLVPLPPPRALPENSTLSFSIQPRSSSQEPEHFWPNGSARVLSQKQYRRSPIRQPWWQSRPQVKFLVQHPSLPMLNKLLAPPLLHRNERTLKRDYTVTK